MLIRSGLGLSFGIVFSVLLFKRRAWPAYVGLGFGAGRAWEECDSVSPHLSQTPNDPTSTVFLKGIEFHMLMKFHNVVVQARCGTIEGWIASSETVDGVKTSGAIAIMDNRKNAKQLLDKSRFATWEICCIVGHGFRQRGN